MKTEMYIFCRLLFLVIAYLLLLISEFSWLCRVAVLLVSHYYSNSKVLFVVISGQDFVSDRAIAGLLLIVKPMFGHYLIFVKTFGSATQTITNRSAHQSQKYVHVLSLYQCTFPYKMHYNIFKWRFTCAKLSLSSESCQWLK